MGEIKVESNPSQQRLDSLSIFHCPVWTKGVSEFPWIYHEQETCYFLEGEVIVTPQGGEAVMIKKGDLVTFPRGMSCTWKILKGVRKHYRFGH